MNTAGTRYFVALYVYLTETFLGFAGNSLVETDPLLLERSLHLCSSFPCRRPSGEQRRKNTSGNTWNIKFHCVHVDVVRHAAYAFTLLREKTNVIL